MKTDKIFYQRFVLLVFIGFFNLLPSFSSNILHAEEIVRSAVNLKDLISEGLSNNRDLATSLEEWEATKHRAPQASALPDPTAGTAIMGEDLETPLGPQKNIYEFEQMIPFPGKLLEKRRMATAEAHGAEAKFKETRRDVILKISETYYDLYATDNIVQTVEEIQDILKKFEAIAQNRYASQSGSQRDVAKAQAEVSQALERLFVLRQQRNTLEALLNSLLNRNPSSKIENLTKPEVPALSPALDQLLELARKNRPELQGASAMLERQKHATALSKYEYAPDFSVGFQYIEIGNGTTTNIDDGRDAWMIPLKITLPLWQNRITPGVQEAKRSLNASEARLKQEENLTDYEVKGAYYHLTSAKQVIDLYENALLPEAELAFHSDQAGYEAGKVDILNLIDSERIYLNAKIAYYQAQADTLKNFAALERAVGINLTNEGETHESH